MFLQKSFTLIVICALFAGQTLARQKTISQTDPHEISPSLKKESLALLRESIRDILNLKIAENRQYFSIEAADLMWSLDEKESRAMFQSAMSDLRQLLAQTVAEISKSESKPVEGSEVANVYATNTNSAEYENYYRLDPALRSRMQKILTVRAYLIRLLAERIPQAADDYLGETAQTIAASKFKSIYGGGNDAGLERHIALQFLKNDPDSAVAVVQRSVSKGFSSGTLTVLDEIYNRDQERGSRLAEEVLQKLKASKPERGEAYRRNDFALQFFRKAIASFEKSKSQTDKKPLLPETSLRELANYFAQVVAVGADLRYALLDLDVISAIEKYAPERTAEIREARRRYAEMSTNTMYSDSITNVMVNSNTAVAVNSNTAVVVNSNTMNANVGSLSADEAKKYRDRAQKALERQKQAKAERDAVSEKLKQKNPSAEDKTFIVGQIRKFVSELKERDDKIKGLVFWATESAQSGNKEIAEILMREAEGSVVGTETRSYRDYMSNWWLANGYSQIAPEKSFAILEKTIPPLNDVIFGFTKFIEFTDERRDMVINGEILMVSGGSFSDAGMIDTVLTGLQGSRRVARNLAEANFARTKSLTDKFERLEFRLLMRVLLLRSLLKPIEEPKGEGAATTGRSTLDDDDY